MVGPEVFGNKINLRPLDTEDLYRRVEWLNDAENVRLFTGSLPNRVYGYQDAERWRRNLEADINTYVWSIETKDKRHIGDIDLHSIDHNRGMAKLTILLGDKSFQNNGYGTDTILTLLGYAFTEGRMKSISLRVYDFNKRAIRCYQKCGFAREDPSVGAYWSMTEPNEIFMTITKDRFLAVNPNANTVRT